MQLTRIQKLAVEKSGKNILVSAGAGTGKTRVLVERFLHFVTTGQALVTEILTLTFTEKAANEMKSRILRRLNELGLSAARRELEASYISTIHAFASRVLKEHPVEAGVHPDFYVIESEEAALLQEKALDDAIEALCVKGSDIFELLRIYGEQEIRGGIQKIFRKARTEGKSFSEFFASRQISGNEESKSVAPAFEKLGEKELAKEWKKFSALESWDWNHIGEFQTWLGSFSRRGKKSDKAEWKKLSRQCLDFLAAKLDLLAQPLRPQVEQLALAFEAIYEAQKREKGALDFNDLEIKAFELFTKQKPANQKLLKHYRGLFKFILVDEFQDTNPLQTGLVEILSSQNNLFFVGDYKQSIYGFRGTSPAHFLEKENLYRDGDSGVRIPMLENFRTASGPLEFINRFFEKLWKEDRLVYEDLMAFPENGEGHPTELLLIRPKDDESLDALRMREAAMIAARIAGLHEAGEAYGDMAILFQARTSVSIYEQALARAEIPYFVVSSAGFYHQPEIRDIMSILSCLENPLSDIPLAASLRSPFFHVTDDTLFWLARYAKAQDETRPLYEGIKNFEAIPEISGDEKKKLQAFKLFLEEMLQEKDRLRLAELLDKILEKTSYELSILADRHGVRRFANLKKLVNLAREYESLELVSLGDFIRAIKNLETTSEVRESEAQVEAEESRKVVRLMTIHAAKGLEFPVCFVADLAYQGRNPESKRFLAETGIGYSFELQNPVTREWERPASYLRIYESIAQRENEEWKRLFYVAMTRAKSRLILSGVHREKKKAKESFHEMSCWMDWVMTLANQVPLKIKEEMSAPPAGRRPLVPAETKKFERLFADRVPNRSGEIEKAGDEILERLAHPDIPPSRTIDLPVSAFVLFAKDPERYWRVYEMGFPDSQIEKMDSDEDARAGVDPEEEISIAASEFGTLIHRVLEHVDFKRPERNSQSLVAEVFKGMNEKAIAEARKILADFMRSPLCHELAKARKIYRELPFILNERHGRVHGVIDLLFQDESGAWHVVDYKTAVGDAGKVAGSEYDLQIRIYALAAYEILRTAPQSGRIHFLKNQWQYRENFDAAFMTDFAARFRQIQNDILDYQRGNYVL